MNTFYSASILRDEQQIALLTFIFLSSVLMQCLKTGMSSLVIAVRAGSLENLYHSRKPRWLLKKAGK